MFAFALYGDGSTPFTDLHLVVIALKLATQLFELFLQPSSLSQLGSTTISFLLEAITTLLIFLVLLFQTPHISKQLARALSKMVDFLHVIHLGNLLHQVSVCSFDFALCLTSVNLVSLEI